MPKFETLSPELSERIRAEKMAGNYIDHSFDEKYVTRRKDDRHDEASVWRTAFIRDIDKIMHCPYYSRYADKTQVFSLYKNDDLTRRSLHVQLVSRIARTIGKALNLNLDLIEAISLGHDIGHTPFGHAGEKFLDALYREHTGRRFTHNIQSVRVLDGIFPYNISLQTLNGIAAHNGEFEQSIYEPRPMTDFAEFDRIIEASTEDRKNMQELYPSTLEACVVCISDIIAYLGKDRQDAERAKLILPDMFYSGAIGSYNSEIINNMIVNIIENSYGKPYIKMDEEHFEALKRAKTENYALIYESDTVKTQMQTTVKPIFTAIYERLLDDLDRGNKKSTIFTHHINYVNRFRGTRGSLYGDNEDHNRIVVDYIASMTDDYCVDLYNHLFPASDRKVVYKGYFD